MVKLLDKNGVPIQGAYIAIYGPSGIAYNLNITDGLGEASFKLLKGEYEIKAYFATSYWLTPIKSSTFKGITLEYSTVETLTLHDYPPSFWSTLGFMMLIVLIITATIIICLFLYSILRRKH